MGKGEPLRVTQHKVARQAKLHRHLLSRRKNVNETPIQSCTT